MAYNQSDPNSGSNEAGLPEWSTAGFAHVESRIRDAIQNWGVRYFKFDFMVWLDCEGVNDLYQHHDAFVAMIDRLRHDFPGVTFQTDDTNDYRLFPFESTLRGPLWFQNGSPEPSELLHNLWILSPYVPAYTIGQAALGGDSGGKKAWERFPIGTLMAAALPSHLTFWRDLRTILLVERVAGVTGMIHHDLACHFTHSDWLPEAGLADPGSRSLPARIPDLYHS